MMQKTMQDFEQAIYPAQPLSDPVPVFEFQKSEIRRKAGAPETIGRIGIRFA
jgi:hypothetical protein